MRKSFVEIIVLSGGEGARAWEEKLADRVKAAEEGGGVELVGIRTLAVGDDIAVFLHWVDE